MYFKILFLSFFFTFKNINIKVISKISETENYQLNILRIDLHIDYQ